MSDDTTYYCAPILGDTAWTMGSQWSAPMEESNSDFDCPQNMVMISRAHLSFFTVMEPSFFTVMEPPVFGVMEPLLCADFQARTSVLFETVQNFVST